MKKLLTLALTGMMTCGLLACSGSIAAAPEGTVPAEDRIATYAVYVDPILQWDPSGSVSNEIMVFNNIYETLVRYNPTEDAFENVLATEYSVSEDGLVWTFKLREGVKFHDGTEMTAEDVKFSLDRTKDGGQAQAYLWVLVDSIDVVDDYTVEFHLLSSTALDIILAGCQGAYIYSKDAYDANNDIFTTMNECGSGPYTLHEVSTNENVVLSAFPDYWGGWNENQIGTAIIMKSDEASSRRQLIESGEVEVTHMLTNEDFAALDAIDTVNVVEAPTLKNINCLFNTIEGPTSDPNFRKALACAIPYDDIINSACGGYARKASGYVPGGLWGHSDDLDNYAYDMEKAKEYLAASEYADQDINLVLSYQSGDETLRITAELMQASFKELGIEMECRALTWDSQWDLARSENPADRQDVLLEYWMLDTASPYSFIHGPYSTEEEPANNLSYYSNPEVDAILAEADQLSGVDRDAAAEKYVEAQKMILEDCPGLALCDKLDVYATSESIGDVPFNAAYTFVVRFYDCTLN